MTGSYATSPYSQGQLLRACGYQDVLPIRKDQLPGGMGGEGGVACREREGGYCLTDVVISKSGLENEEEN